MSKKRRSRFSLLKNYYKRVWPVLGPACHGDKNADGKGGILLMKRDNIGDFVLGTAFMNAASRRWSNMPVTIACSPGLASLAGLLYPQWSVRQIDDDVGEYKKSRWNPGSLQRAVRSWATVDQMINLRAMRFQEEMIFDSWVPARNKTALVNRFHYHDASYRMVPDKRVYSDVIESGAAELPHLCREIAGYRKLLRHFFPDENADELWPKLEMGRRAEAAEQALVQKGFRGVNALVLCPFPSAEIKRYSFELLIPLVSKIARRYDLAVDILGGPGDRSESVELARRIECPKGVRSFAGEFSLLESLTAVANARVVLGVDTGLMHAAIAASTPSVVILGGAHYGHFGPWGNPRRTKWLSHPMPCYDCNWECTQAEPFCIRSIPPELVEGSVDEVLKNA